MNIIGWLPIIITVIGLFGWIIWLLRRKGKDKDPRRSIKFDRPPTHEPLKDLLAVPTQGDGSG